MAETVLCNADPSFDNPGTKDPCPVSYDSLTLERRSELAHATLKIATSIEKIVTSERERHFLCRLLSIFIREF